MSDPDESQNPSGAQTAEEFLPKAIMLTGGAGFIGSHVACRLATAGFPLVIVDKLDYCASMANLAEIIDLDHVTFCKQDITDIDAVTTIFRHHPEIDTVMHFAAQTHVDNSFGNSFTFTHNNVMGTHVLLEASKVHDIKRFVHVSTDEVYGDGASGIASTECSSFAPTNPYAATKCAAECLVKAYERSFGLPTIITRSNNIFGPKQYPEKLIPKFISLLLRQQKAATRRSDAGQPSAVEFKLPIHGDGQNCRNYLFCDDVAAAFELILRRGVVGEIYNIGTELVKKNMEVAADLIKSFGFAQLGSDDAAGGVSDYIEYVSDRPFNDLRYTLDSSKLNEVCITCMPL